MEETWLPFTEEELSSHFFDVDHNTGLSRHLKEYQGAIDDYKNFLKTAGGYEKNMSQLNTPCRIEKDERFWTACTLMKLFHNDKKVEDFSKLFRMAYNLEKPPIEGFSSWEDCFEGGLDLRFEVHLPSSESYLKWLKTNQKQRQIIPYVLKGVHREARLETATHVDAILFNRKKRFAALIEAKVISDMSCTVTNDICRNQLSRMVDVMMEIDDGKTNRSPDKTLIVLLTPELTRKEPGSRYYGYKYLDYKSNPNKIAADLPHKKIPDCKKIADRIGWMTWEDCRKVNEKCCSWLAY